MPPDRSRSVCRISWVVLALGLTVLRASAHGPDYPPPTTEERAGVEPALEGAAAFVDEVHRNGRALFDDQRLGLIGRAHARYRYARELREGRVAGVPASDSEYHRWRGDEALRELMSSVPAFLRFDFSPGAASPKPHHRLVFDGVNHHLIAVVHFGEGPIRFVRQDLNLKTERYALHYTLAVKPEGTNCFLLRLREVPTWAATVILQIKKQGAEEAFSWHSLTVTPAEQGQLSVQIVEEGQAVPAMVRLKSLPSGALWPPQGALDFRSQLHDITEEASPPMLNIYGSMGSFELRLPGSFAGHYWVVPAGFEMSVPAGEWELTVWRGLETKPLQKRFTVAAGRWTREEVELERWADLAGSGWYSGDDHVHAQLMGGTDAQRLLTFTRAMDIRVSNILAMGDSQRTYFEQRGFGPEFRASEEGYWLVPGQEDPRSMLGHNIGMNLTAFARDLDRYLLLDWLADEIHAQGGLFGQTHVGQNVCEAHRGMALMLPFEVYDFCSIMQGGLGTELYYDSLDLGFRLTATAGSDMPYAGVLGDVRTYVYLGRQPFTPDTWFDAVRLGRTFVTNGPLLEFTVNDALPGDVISITDDRPLIVQASARGLAGESAPRALEIVALGAVVGDAKAEADGNESLSMKIELPPGEGGWIAARAWGVNGSAAHTTPVWVERPGKRCWNRAKAAELIEKELAVLVEIEAVIDQVETRNEEGTLGPFDFWDRRILEQAEPLRALLRQSRESYETLRRQANSGALPPQ